MPSGYDWAALQNKWDSLLQSKRGQLSIELLFRFQAELIYYSSNLEYADLLLDDAERAVAGQPPVVAPTVLGPQIAQAYGQKRALDLVEDYATRRFWPHLEQFVRALHYEVMRDVPGCTPGAYRTDQRPIPGSKLVTPLPQQIQSHLVSFQSKFEVFFSCLGTNH